MHFTCLIACVAFPYTVVISGLQAKVELPVNHKTKPSVLVFVCMAENIKLCNCSALLHILKGPNSISGTNCGGNSVIVVVLFSR
jgi:hypothetical protein